MAGSVALPLISDLSFLNDLSPLSRFPIRLFSKPLDSYDFDFTCECVDKAGIGGLDLTVRLGGMVEPAKVETVLPELIQRAAKHNLSIDMIVTSIQSSSEVYTERIIRTAASAGIKYYRLGWFEYDPKRGIWDTIQKYRNNLSGILELNKKYKIHAGYQNHSGSLVGGPVWDLNELLRDFPPEYIGSQYDVRHAMVEGTNTWMIGMKLISGHIKTLAMKDFIWRTEGGKPQPVTVPMGEGMVDWDLFFQLVKDLNIDAPMTLHVEYPLLEKDEEKFSLEQKQQIISGKLKKDVDFIKTYLKKYKLI